MNYRPATATDAQEVAEWIDSAAACFRWAGASVGYPINRSSLVEDLQISNSQAWAQECDGRLSGFGQLVEKEPGHLHLARLIVDPARRGGGLGRDLAMHLLGEARRQRAHTITLNVAADNEFVARMYASMGFRRPVHPGRPADSRYLPMVFVGDDIRELERHYARLRGKTARPLDHWHFCDNEADADALVELVLRGEKRATSPSKWWFDANGIQLPEVGDAEIVTDWWGQAQCVLELTRVAVVAFEDIDENYARREGEGDKSLEYWKRTHWDYYARELEGTSHQRSTDMPIVCIEFEVALSCGDLERSDHDRS